ncbi:hypothetical protein MKY41_08410 [Sporosarcina sp. FSL W7-1349]|uniref:hypothetical protein n=1 Tax=Sporosarcina sp. FSL W7-1349 TaxID=2921561 RepID=UPI0030FA6950
MVRKITDQIHLLFDGDSNKWKWSDFHKMWDEGELISDIAKACGTNQKGVALLLIDQDYKGENKPRRNGVFGH